MTGEPEEILETTLSNTAMPMFKEEPIHGPEEVQLLALLREVQQVLADALNSLDSTSRPPIDVAYLGWTAVSVNQAAEGYLWLRDSGRVAASKLLVRPALEAVFSGIAAVKDHRFLFRKAYSEWGEEKKMFANDQDGQAAANHALEDLKRAFKQACPGYPVECKGISAKDTAQMADLLEIYDRVYRIYCQFTHGALMAVMEEGLKEATDPMDTGIVVWCVLMILDKLKEHTRAQIPDLPSLQMRLQRLQ